MSDTILKARWGQISLLFSANFLSLLGNGLSAIAIPWFVYDLTGNAVITATVAIAGQLPNIIVGLFSGPLIDRYSARTVSIFCDAVNAVAVLLIPLLYTVEMLDVALLGFLVFLSQVIDVPGQTSKAVMIPALIDKEGLPRERVNGLNSLLETGADLLTPSLAGILIAAFGATTVLLLDSLSFLMALMIVSMGIKASHVSAPPQSEPQPTKEAWKWMFTTPSILKLGIYDLIINTVAVSLLSLVLPVLANANDKQAIWLGIWLTCFACGTTLTTIAYTVLGHRISSLRLLQLTPIGQAIGLALLLWVFADIANMSLTPTTGIVAALGMFLYGLNLGVGSVVDATVLQKLVPEAKRGTVFSTFSSLRYTGVPLGLLLSGILLEQNNPTMLFGTFIGLLLVNAVIWLWGRLRV
ncbi:MFS transporter [Pseudovibrio brasiliensis]|uniref:MFS transporter n=1 Tax=Pseudovibrio brasiliensis TaxID=1898042 RepID=A0ABX8AYL2_9HYPH|nr:MFS transporter [Pseudovibrio brasiliensis]QUS58945.1 MFS transporter [Pseudovibrio brasiliensis]